MGLAPSGPLHGLLKGKEARLQAPRLLPVSKRNQNAAESENTTVEPEICEPFLLDEKLGFR